MLSVIFLEMSLSSSEKKSAKYHQILHNYSLSAVLSSKTKRNKQEKKKTASSAHNSNNYTSVFTFLKTINITSFSLQYERFIGTPHFLTQYLKKIFKDQGF